MGGFLKGNLFSGSTMTDNTWRVKWVGVGDTWYDQWLFEILSDTTNDTGDFVQICYDSTLDGGATPHADDYLVNYTGHSKVTVYVGTGTGWAPTSDLDVKVASTIGTSNSSATPHWIIEIDFENPWESTGVRVAAYDASANTTLMWPPETSANVPNDYGYSEISYEIIPEGLSVGALVLLSTAAAFVGMRFLRKRPKIIN